jgi:hypothetical protein
MLLLLLSPNVRNIWQTANVGLFQKGLQHSARRGE